MTQMSKEQSKVKKGGLGRGLSALLNNAETDITVSGEYRAGSGVHFIDLNDIEANPFQPRTEFEQKALEELSESIKIHGLIQPVTVRKMGYDKYQLISGERRTRASILAGLKKIPAYIRVANDQEMLEMALIENIQRENLNPIEVSLSYKRLLEECNLKQEELGERVGKDRSTVSNYLRLLKLPDEVQKALQVNSISMGHAKALLGVEDSDEQLVLFHRIENEHLSVRGTEQIVKQSKEAHSATAENDTATKKEESKVQNNLSEEVITKYDNLKELLEAKISIRQKGKKGEIIIPYTDEEDLERILNILA